LTLRRANEALLAGWRGQIAEDLPNQSWGARPIFSYTAAWLHDQLGNDKAARNFFRNAGPAPPDYCFPSRLEEIAVLDAAGLVGRALKESSEFRVQSFEF
jgi:hypothetical protein